MPINFFKKIKKVLTRLNFKTSRDAVIISVAHDEFSQIGIKKLSLLLKERLNFDLKGIFQKRYRLQL